MAAAVFGRERELAVADEFLDSAGERGGVLIIEGEAGIGKTTVWQEVVRRSGERGMRMLTCRPAEAEAKLALSAVADLLEGVPGDAFAALPDPQRRALDAALLRVDWGREALEPRMLAAALRTLLAELSRDGPVIVAVDDVQWLDGSSATALGFALRRVGDRRIGWVFARRFGLPIRLAAEDAAPVGSPTRLAIGPLSRAALHRVLEERIEQPLTRPSLLRVYETSGGNPFYALEIARALAATASRDPTAPLAVPEDVRQLVYDRIHELPLDAREALLAAAVLARPTSEVVERATSAAGLAAAEETGLIQVGSFRLSLAHPLYAAAIHAAASTARRRGLHRRLAQAIARGHGLCSTNCSPTILRRRSACRRSACSGRFSTTTRAFGKRYRSSSRRSSSRTIDGSRSFSNVGSPSRI